MFYNDIQEKLHIPVIHIGIATGKAIKDKKISKVGLLGTKHTMERDFYTEKLKEMGIETFVPDEPDRKIISDIYLQRVGKKAKFLINQKSNTLKSLIN
jgi:aspartate racemase